MRWVSRRPTPTIAAKVRIAIPSQPRVERTPESRNDSMPTGTRMAKKATTKPISTASSSGFSLRTKPDASRAPFGVSLRPLAQPSGLSAGCLVQRSPSGNSLEKIPVALQLLRCALQTPRLSLPRGTPAMEQLHERQRRHARIVVAALGSTSVLSGCTPEHWPIPTRSTTIWFIKVRRRRERSIRRVAARGRVSPDGRRKDAIPLRSALLGLAVLPRTAGLLDSTRTRAACRPGPPGRTVRPHRGKPARTDRSTTV
jgi:hypothetical protein